MSKVHTPRFEARSLTLDSCINLKLMENSWKKYVKQGMRHQDLLDLYDYFDFHRNRKALIRIIRHQIIEGKYKSKPPQLIRAEKKYGICRHIMIPTPEDAVVLQSIVECLAPIIKKAQPSKRAYFSRSHRPAISQEEIDESFPYEWWELWPAFQKRIYEFSSTFKYVVVTDIANYFDNISFRHLRNRISSYGKIDEVLLDFMFYMLESWVWRPDFLPLSGIGLPQVNFDAPRLLAHSFLFEVDEYLAKETNNNFVRWMDDIDFGVNEVEKAKEILRGLDEILLSRGVRLNMGKTKILSSDDAKDYFLPDENRYLTIITKRIRREISAGKPIDESMKYVKKRFRKFLKRPHIGSWDKLFKRYFTIAGVAQDRFLEDYVPMVLMDNPRMRDSAFRYYTNLGPNKKRFNQLIDFYESKHCFDDRTVFAVAKVLTDWHISPGSKLRPQIIKLATVNAKKSETHLLAGIWLLAKYGSSKELGMFLGKHSNTWKYSSFLSRQVAAVIPKIRNIKGQYQFLIRTFTETGQMEALKVVRDLDSLKFEQPLNRAIKSYILHGDKPIKTYPLGKFLISIDLLSCNEIAPAIRESLRKELLVRIPDPIYKKELNEILL